MADALSALLGLQSAQAPLLGLEDMRKRRLLEMERNRELTAGNPHAAAGATAADVAGLKSDISQDPTTGDYMDQQVMYQSPFETQKRDVAQSDALAKLLLPERAKSQNAMDLEKLRGENALAVAREKGTQAGAGQDLFTPEGQAAAASLMAVGKTVPGMTRSPQTIAGVVNYLGQTQPGINIGANEAAYRASAGSLGKLQTTQDAATAFINTADQNGALLVDAMKHAPGIGIPLFDKPIRHVARSLGNEAMKSIDAIRNSVNQEYSRILSNPGMGGVVTQTERNAIDSIMSDDSSQGQILASLAQLKAEAQNRLASYQQQLGTVQGRIGEIGGGGTPAPAGQQYLSGSGWE